MKRAIVLEHVRHEGPGRIAPLCAALGYALDERRLFDGDAVPARLADGDLLIVMGGPMGVADVGDGRYPFLGAEIDLLRSCVARSEPVLGICLGAQLLAHAAGAAVRANPVREVGWAPVDFTAPDDPALAGLDAQEVMLHWHGDTFALPTGAVHLASTPLCRNQAFRLGSRQFGLQFHGEIDESTVIEWVREDADYVLAACGTGGGERIIADTRRFIARHRQVGDRLLGNILGFMTR